MMWLGKMNHETLNSYRQRRRRATGPQASLDLDLETITLTTPCKWLQEVPKAPQLIRRGAGRSSSRARPGGAVGVCGSGAGNSETLDFRVGILLTKPSCCRNRVTRIYSRHYRRTDATSYQNSSTPHHTTLPWPRSNQTKRMTKA